MSAPAIPAPASPAAQPSWAGDGFIDLPDVLSAEIWDRLTVEAEALQPTAAPGGFTNVAAHHDGSFCSPSRFRSCRGGPALTGVLRDLTLLHLVREVTGLPRLIPVRSGWVFYRSGDYMGVHRDSVKATVTISFTVTGALGPMSWAPSLRTVGNDVLGRLVAEYGPFPADGFEAFEVPVRGLRGFDGYNTPHYRAPFEGEVGILGNFCYFDL
ncbi:hypothetical protein [Dactylosporangium sp. NPDC005555]|uniref:hypothetical protein n=1 Tax=Dactylosporangium sp. NPDC005555 TaxID=3154889 RepID=UPI0033B85CA7